MMEGLDHIEKHVELVKHTQNNVGITVSIKVQPGAGG